MRPFRATACLSLYRPEHPDCDDNGELAIIVTGSIWPGEPESYDSPGYDPDVDLDAGPFEIDDGHRPARYVTTTLDRLEEDRAVVALREASAEEYDR